MAKAEATIRIAVDAFLSSALSSARCANRNTRRAYGDALDTLAGHLGASRALASVSGGELGDALQHLWDQAAASTWNQCRHQLLAGLVLEEWLHRASAPALAGTAPRARR